MRAAIVFDVDLVAGQKTGLFLDQRENHQAAARYARGRTLDAFTYNGGFALHMATRASEVLALDSSAPAVAATRGNAARNGLGHVEVREANVFDELRELEVSGASFDTIVLDPPAFAKNRAALERAAAGYKEINLRALRLLAPGGHLLTCSCSYNVNEEHFLAIIESAAADARVSVALVEKRLQSRDHPVLDECPGDALSQVPGASEDGVAEDPTAAIADTCYIHSSRQGHPGRRAAGVGTTGLRRHPWNLIRLRPAEGARCGRRRIRRRGPRIVSGRHPRCRSWNAP